MDEKTSGDSQRFLVTLPAPLVKRIEKRAYERRKKAGRWFRNDEIRALIEKGLAAERAGV